MCKNEKICQHCQQICNTYLESDGIERCEFWGQVSYIELFTELSDCCNSEDLYSLEEAFEILGDCWQQQSLF